MILCYSSAAVHHAHLDILVFQFSIVDSIVDEGKRGLLNLVEPFRDKIECMHAEGRFGVLSALRSTVRYHMYDTYICTYLHTK